MKSTCFALLLISALMMHTSCEKDEGSSLDQSIQGEWTLASTFLTGPGGGSLVADSSGHSAGLIINKTTYTELLNDSITTQTAYTIEFGLGHDGQSTPYLILDNGQRLGVEVSEISLGLHAATISRYYLRK